MRQVVLDTETTGLEPEHGGHRVIELGAVELVDRRITGRQLQLHIDPEREIDDAAYDVHGLDRAFLTGKPKFAEIADQFLAFVAGAEVIIHNAPFDVAFIDYELSLLDRPGTARLGDLCTVTDSLALARSKHPGQKNGLDTLLPALRRGQLRAGPAQRAPGRRVTRRRLPADDRWPDVVVRGTPTA